MSTASSERPALPETVREQHQHLAERIRELQQALENGRGSPALLDQLLSDFNRHFAHEEQLMEHGGYPELTRHQHEHESFLARVRAMRAHSEPRESEIMGLLAAMLHAWFEKHEASSDRRAAEFLKLEEW